MSALSSSLQPVLAEAFVRWLRGKIDETEGGIQVIANELGLHRRTVEKYLASPPSANPTLNTLVAAMQLGLVAEGGGMLVGRRVDITPSFELHIGEISSSNPLRDSQSPLLAGFHCMPFDIIHTHEA